MSEKKNVGEEPQTPDNRQSWVKPGTPPPSTRRLSADVPEFVPTPRRPRFTGTPHPARPRVRELTAREAAAEMKAWYAQEDPEGAYAATAGTCLSGTQYDNGLLQASEGPYMHQGYPNYPDYYVPPQSRYSLSQFNAEYQALYASTHASLNQTNFPPSTPAQQMRTGPESIASFPPRQETHPYVYSHPSAPPQTPLNRSGGTGFPVNANQAYQAAPERTPTPFHAHYGPEAYPSTFAPGDLSSSSYAQWGYSNDRQRAPVQHAATGAALHPSALPPRGVPSESPVRQGHSSIRRRAPVQHPPSGAAVHSSDLAPRGVPYDTPVRQPYPSGRQRAPVQHAGSGAAAHPSALPPRGVSSESLLRQAHPSIRRRARAQHVQSGAATHSSPLASRNAPYDYSVRQPYPSDRQRVHTQHAPSGLPDPFAASAPRNVLTGSPVRQARPSCRQRVCTPYPSPGRSVPFPAFDQGSLSSTTFEQWAASTGQQRIPAQHAEAVSALSHSTLASEYMPPSAFAQQAYPTDRQRVPAQLAAADLRVHSSNFAPGTTPSSSFAPQVHSTGHQGTSPAVPYDPFAGAPSSLAAYINAPRPVPPSSLAAITNLPRPAPPTWPGHENFTMDEVKAFIKKVQIEDWLRQMRHHQILAQLHASNLKRGGSETPSPKQKATATEQSGTNITEAAQRALEQRLANQIRLERLDERERAMLGIPDPQEAADRAQFQRIMETYNYKNYSREPVNPRLPHAHIVASDPERQELVSVLETVFSNLSRYRHGYAPFPGSLYSQTDQSSTGQAPTSQPSSRPGTGRITDSIPDWSDPTIRNNPEIRRDFFNDSTIIPFMEPAKGDGNLRMPQDNPELPMSDSKTTSSSEGTSATPMDTPSLSEYTPTESSSDEGRIPQPTVPAVPASEEEKTPGASAHAVSASQQVKTPSVPAHAAPVTEQEKTPRASAHAVPTSEQEKTPKASVRPVHVSEQTSQPLFRVVDRPWTGPNPLIGAVFGGTDADMPPRRRSAGASRSASKSAQKKTPQPSAPAAPAPEKKTTSAAPVPVAPTTAKEDAPQLRTPQSPPDPKMPADISSTGPAPSRASTVSPAANISSSETHQPAVTYANILAGLVRAPRPSSAAQNPGNTGYGLRAPAAIATTYTSTGERDSTGYPPYQPWFQYGCVGQTPVLQWSPLSGVRPSQATIVSGPSTTQTRYWQPVPMSQSFGSFNSPGPLTVQTTHSAPNQPGAAGVLPPSETANQAQDTAAEGTPGESANPGTQQRRKRKNKKNRKAPKLDEAASQQDLDAPEEDASLPTEAQ